MERRRTKQEVGFFAHEVGKVARFCGHSIAAALGFVVLAGIAGGLALLEGSLDHNAKLEHVAEVVQFVSQGILYCDMILFVVAFLVGLFVLASEYLAEGWRVIGTHWRK